MIFFSLLVWKEARKTTKKQGFLTLAEPINHKILGKDGF